MVPKRISAIKFEVLSPQEIRRMSVVKIITPETYDDDGFPIDGGLMDTRLGVIDPGLRCKTCGGKAGECPGHFGHVELAAPVIHVGYAKMIARLLNGTCSECGRILLKDERRDKFIAEIERRKELNQSYEEVVKEVFRLTKAAKKCPHCGAEQLEVKFDKPTFFYLGEHRLTPKDVREWLEKIPDDDLPAFGINPKATRPEWFVLTVLPVPPVTVRPSIILETGQRSEDDLTHKLVDIIRINQRFMENKEAGAPQQILEDLWELLQYHVTTYIDNEVSGIPPARHRSGRPLKTLAQRLKGKEGRFRGSLSGKRVNFSARTVISPDPCLSINEVGVPREIAEELTVPIYVTPQNIDMAREFVLRSEHPKANYIVRPDGRRIRVIESNKEELAEKLEPGWIVERQLMDGDIVLFNRQPSLHRMSIMAHYVRVLPYKTFRLNPAVCPPYNADFDGDEMNLHVPQSLEAQAEAKILMAVQEHILSPRFGGPIIGGIHDHISGLYLLTRGEKKFTREEAMELLRSLDISEIPVKDEYTGKEIFSFILPDITLEFKAEICQGCEECKGAECEYDAYVIIENGKLLKGTIDEKAVGAFKGIIIDEIARKYGKEMAKKFIDDMTQLAIRIISKLGFTVGIDDEDIPPEAAEQIEEVLKEAENEVNRLIEAYRRGDLEPMPGRSIEETLEMRIMQVLGRARDRAGKIAQRHLGMDNAAVIMAVSGARGSMLNLTQMAACIGQQSVRGERISRGYTYTNRTLSHFKPGDLGAEARGFVRSSYKKGLSPVEFFFHAAGGREGLVDTAVRTSQSGYLQRRMINALQDLKVEYDGTVREQTSGALVQFRYGEDGVDPMRSFRGKPVDVRRIIREVIGEVKK
ncbi:MULTISPECIES: DNA-directed RNA polymerase subunit A' [Archaeoglobus]|jgi:DNA-directed RNA polymerase subunit A'|uniref:DNA-directed RNA polymerase subunit Rpo1N n=3 Tax=Archaeoglobus fulgidus TaxID=2234 RepID=O28391_ARCFU|nr:MULTISPECIES: DNA-directed RNA polymerase subunit A' [Archaeoglobus]AAB89365.1 DNA-directed RNA polymerase, subunit A' (rpoA1) [Archaeoglobus fulgidus DSM 4304]AIG98883.1 DNA-directed RNA polymerase subunit A' [Archaeoglobus fulgidus DSM 8774]KUJ93961.1 MAG: DNA-directed RNA polymerase [Archaeoglobus fulgidus]KUK07412.1 MAG: DNA-directed RNA polymerase [Archaeoglobus fulgidus]MDI3497767.1 DNA-directed polymerase subunit [Archaeoglobus sp.]